MSDRSAAAIAAAGEKRAEAAASGQVEALLFERQGYVVRGLPERVAAVDAALAALGYKATAPAAETAAAPKPRTRKA